VKPPVGASGKQMGHVPFGDVGEVVVTLQHATVVEIEFLHCKVSVD
jgi:hypothetical protein